jgi:hypothetical protein
LPANGSVHAIEQDFVKPDLLFIGTEFGAYFSINGGQSWVQLKAGLPSIPVYDLAIQKRENDLVLATFGRGFYILDNYAPLRELTGELPTVNSHLFAIKDALLYIQTGKKYGQGASYFLAPNPEFGANFTFYLKDVPKMKKEARHEIEKKLFDEGKPIPQPSLKELEEENNEVPSYLLITIRDSEGSIIRTMTKEPAKGINRFNWDLSYDSPRSLNPEKFDPFAKRDGSVYVLPGTYSVEISLVQNGQVTQLAQPANFNVKGLNNTTLPASNREKMVAFQKEISRLSKAMIGAIQLTNDLKKEVITMKQTALTLPSAHEKLLPAITDIEKELDGILFTFNGYEAKASSEEIPPVDMPLFSRLNELIDTQISSTADITATSTMLFNILKDEFPTVLERIKAIAEVKIVEARKLMDEKNAPYTPGRVPVWK